MGSAFIKTLNIKTHFLIFFGYQPLLFGAGIQFFLVSKSLLSLGKTESAISLIPYGITMAIASATRFRLLALQPQKP